MTLDKDGNSKGFAFVEFMTEVCLFAVHDTCLLKVVHTPARRQLGTGHEQP